MLVAESEKCVFKYDRRLFDIEKQLNILRYLNPVNARKEKEKFLRAYAGGETYNPVFEYESCGPEVGDFCRDLKKIREKLERCKGSVFAPFYIKKINYLLRFHDLLIHRDSPDFGNELSAFYGLPSGPLLLEAQKNLERLKNEQVEKNLSPGDVRGVFETELKRLGLEWEVRPADGGGVKMAVNAACSEIHIDFSSHFSKAGIKGYLCHEIGTHVFRAENGKFQPLMLFRSGFPGYMETEEGLAAYNESKNGLLVPENLKKYSARVVAAAICNEASFSEIVDELTGYFSPEEAFTFALRVKRGLHDTSLPGGYTKDCVYLSGFRKVSAFLQKQPSEQEALKVLYCGKIGLRHFELARDLLAEGFLKQPRYLPEANPSFSTFR
ncbi:tyrosine/phenylalanine carboxypeptidase domain-containing protein [Methanosarcina sp. 1.H.A.2.2]|uniref:tyrosine/phenylalanine carboxypeptidase domain-containing protein n=1 Tax=Methanosarcina sp. 1.H.A.2.2 TaxID=1483601 RepID=UPI000622437D|nr:tyrosine/phenylalanine carboxypeptidase domain-containing protein [Methanosarcina sp. 1.H.A.2.2]KKH47463.1 hypothetical protein EO93_10235 [Methanosarcina sp. 1.H.A.2.2]